MIDYIRDGQAIYRQSFATIRAEANLAGIPADLEKLAVRVIHACGMVDVVDDLRFARRRAARALAAGAAILCDARMVAEGVTRSRLPAANRVICTLNEADVPALATELGNTRSAVALEHWREHLEGSVVVIGNAPTALFYLLEMLDAGAPKPALILGFPVGFVGAAESRRCSPPIAAGALRDRPRSPWRQRHGRRGGERPGHGARMMSVVKGRLLGLGVGPGDPELITSRPCACCARRRWSAISWPRARRATPSASLRRTWTRPKCACRWSIR